MQMQRAMFVAAIFTASLMCAQSPTTSASEADATPTSIDDLNRAVAADKEFFTEHDKDGLTVLQRVVLRGDSAVAQRIIELGGDVNAVGVDAKGRPTSPPLLLTMTGAYNDALRRSFPLKNEPADAPKLTPREREQKTRGQPDPMRGPMQFAAVTKLLIAHGADPRAKMPDGLTVLHVAAMTGNAELIKLLLAAKVDVDALYAPRTGQPHTPLVDAAGSGDVEAVRTLLDAGADLTKVPPAAQGYFLNQAERNIEVFRLLLDRGLTLPANALERATANKHPEAAAEILKRGKGGDKDAALYAAIDSRQEGETAQAQRDEVLRAVRSLLDAGASPNAPNGTGEALVAAVANEQPDVVKLLKERGAKVDWSKLKEHNHEPALIAYDAALRGGPGRLEQFEAIGMPLDTLGAAMLGRTDRLRQVIASDPKRVEGEAGSTALYFAAAYGRLDCVKLLLDAKTDPNARVPSWDTPDIGPRPLEAAATQGHSDVVKLLVDRGADASLITFDEKDWPKVTLEIRAMLQKAKHE